MISSGDSRANLPMPMADPEPGLEQYWRAVRRHWLTASMIFLCTTAFVASHGLRQVPTYEAVGKLRFRNQDPTANLTGLGNNLSARGGAGPLDDPISTEIGIILSTPIIRETIQELELTDAAGQPLNPRAVLGSLRVTNERGTNILTVAYQSPDPKLATQIVDQLMTVYLEEQLESNRAEASAARRFIESELPAAESRAQAAEAALRNFKERNEIVAFEESALATVTSLDQVEQKITQVASQLVDTQAQVQILRDRLQQDPQMALVATSLSQSPGIQQALREYQQAEIALAAERTRYQPQHPTVRQLTARRDALAQVLQQRVAATTGDFVANGPADLQLGQIETDLIGEYIRLDARQRGLAQQAGVLQKAQDIYQQRAQRLPQLEQEYRELQRRLDATQSTYSILLQRLQEVRVAENRNVGNVRVIQPAEVLGGAIQPSKKRYLLMGSVLGGVLAVAAAMLCDKLDRSIRTVEEAQAQFQLPVLGVIPSFGKPRRRRDQDNRVIPILVVDKSASLAREAYHLLRSNLRFLDSDAPPKVILVTSSLPEEGKSTVTSNLAAAMAQTGQRVLLIDADLHRPIQHWIWNKPNFQGLSNVLVGDATVSGAVIPVMPNLHVLFAGVLPPNPAALFDSKRMATLLGKFKDHYDFVFLDTPSLSSGASASVLGKLVDGLLLVVRPGVANYSSAQYTRSLLEQSRQRVLGLVVNGAIANYEPYGQYLSEEFFGDANAATATAAADVPAAATQPDRVATGGSKRPRRGIFSQDA